MLNNFFFNKVLNLKIMFLEFKSRIKKFSYFKFVIKSDFFLNKE